MTNNQLNHKGITIIKPICTSSVNLGEVKYLPSKLALPKVGLLSISEAKNYANAIIEACKQAE